MDKSEAAITAAKFAWENRKKVTPQLKRVYRRVEEWWKGKVLLIGPGGTGKTTLARVLAGEIDWLTAAPWEYNPSFNIEPVRMKLGLDVGMLAIPGQKRRRPLTWTQVHKDVAAGRYRGIILVSAFGYHSLDQGGLKVVKPGYRKGEGLTQLLADGRADELAVLRELTRAAAACPKKLWLLSVVTKQDLWYNEDSVVRRHYTAGEYTTVVDELIAARGGRPLRHEIEFVSLVISRFVMATGEIVWNNREGYDQRHQIESVRRLLNAVARLIEWEKLR